MRRRFLTHLAGLVLGAAVLRALPAMALPEDAGKPFEVGSSKGDAEYLIDEGLVIYRGPASDPAWVRQGTMLISGTEIRIKQRPNGEVETATAIGNPARFEQQPQANQEIVHVSGNKIHFDNAGQTLTIDSAAEFSQGDANVTGNRIDYNLTTRSVTASGNGVEKVRSIIPVKPTPQ